ncbi:MAG: sigma-70 family RNA polymerase sigma factor [Gemmataceae bacterium]|nr:sigma-70 family RNA polymerase sigma factor [Gemmataceae bacterium]
MVRRHQDRLFTSVLRLVDSTEDAQDVVQEAFLHAYQALESFKGDAQFFTWLYRIAMNAAISLRRKKKPVARIVGPDGEPVVDPADESAGNRPSDALEQAEQGSTVRRALAKLSAEHRAVLVMKDMEELKYEEMAEALGVPVGTIRSRLHRARLELREILEREEANG